MFRSIVSVTLTFCLIFASISNVIASSNNSDKGIDLDYISKVGIPAFGVALGMFAISPYAKMKREIKTLEEDQIFIRRHLAVMGNSSARKNALSALEVNRAKQQQAEKKFKRFTRWFYPVTAVVGIGLLYIGDQVYNDFK